MSIETLTGNKDKKKTKVEENMMSLGTADAALDLAADIMRKMKEQRKDTLEGMEPKARKEWELRDRLVTMGQLDELFSTMQYAMESITDTCMDREGVFVDAKDLKEIERWRKVTRRMVKSFRDRMTEMLTEVIE